LTALGISENDMIVLIRKVKHNINISDIRLDTPPEQIIQMVQQYPHLRTQFLNADPELGEALNDVAKLRVVIMKRIMLNSKAGFEKEQRLKSIAADPMNEENQKAIAEQIRMENVQANMETAIEELPEAFGRVIMLYMDVEINGTPIKAFVDSGAQSTIMSMTCAERCGIMRLIDHRFAGEARGVGTAKILGRVHIAQMKVGSSYFPISITILEHSDVDFLFGLDMLKRYRCEISLKNNELRIESSSGIECVQFLSEKDLPSNARGTTKEELEGKVSIDLKESSSSEIEKPIASSSGASDQPIIIADRENKLTHLMALGFSENAAKAALEQANGDVEMAATFLLSSL
jgi:DNA damage-inducible protein 1